jgi:hypothetical protein
MSTATVPASELVRQPSEASRWLKQKFCRSLSQESSWELRTGIPLGIPLGEKSGWEKTNGLAAEAAKPLIYNEKNGRDGGIRTRDPLHPMQVRYQAALRPD